MHRKHPPIWNIEYKNVGDVPSSSQNLSGTMKHHDENSAYLYDKEEIELNDIHTHNSDMEQPTTSGSAEEHYSKRIHSIQRHRNIVQPSTKLRKTIQARTGAIDGNELTNLLDFNALENHANLIVLKMEEDPDLMEDSPVSENLRREALRDMPQCLTIKRHVRKKLLKSVNRKSKRKPISCWKSLKYTSAMMMKKYKASLKELFTRMELWYGALKKIEGNFGSGVGSFFKFLRFMFIINVLLTIISVTFIVVPQLIYNTKIGGDHAGNEFVWHDVFEGEGYLADSVLFYGYYSNESVRFLFLDYNIPQGYFFTMTLAYLFCVAVFGYSVAISYRRSFIETEGGLKNVFANKIFCGWDYNIATQNAAKLKSRAIYNELKEILEDDMKEEVVYSCLEKFWTFTMQVTMNLLVLLSYMAVGFSMWYFMSKSEEREWSPIYTALTVNVVMIVCPLVYSGIISYEGYSTTRTNLMITLLRTFLLGAVIITVLLSFIFQRTSGCWETSLGQEIYRLIIFDFLFSISTTPLLYLISYNCFRFFKMGYSHFNISNHTMQIIYNQSLFWVGFMFSPLLALVMVIKLFVMWYVYQTIAMKLCTPSLKAWRAAKTSTRFLMMAFLSLLIATGLQAYIFSNISSSECGPFKSYNFILELLTEGIFNFKSYRHSIFMLFTKPGFIAIILIAMCSLVYYQRAKALARRDLVNIYRNMLTWEARDKEFLVQNIKNVAEGRWQYDQKMSREFNAIFSAPRLYVNNVANVEVHENEEAFSAIP